MHTTKPWFNPRIFWDVDHTNLDLSKKANFIIVRVFERGDVQDIRACRKFYGDEIISEALLNAKHLSPHRAYLASAVINQPITTFRCYTSLQ
ncbi:MAG: hypothetical protein JXR10_04465 [Cyclobacteriaceae bacterium]